jgi:hypothetical protein
VYALISAGLLNATRKQAVLAKQAARTAEQTMVVGQRAYLYLSGIRLMVLESNTVEITYPIFNGGQIPGRFTGEFTRANVYPIRQYPEPINRGTVAVVKKGVVVPPALDESSALKGKYYLQLTKAEAEAVAHGQSWIVFHGFIRYFDIFDNWHDTGFAVAYAGDLAGRHTYFMDWIQQLGFNWFD